MIPDFNHSHLLPPFLGQSHSSASASLYEAGATEFVARFATSSERVARLAGLFLYRAALHGFFSYRQDDQVWKGLMLSQKKGVSPGQNGIIPGGRAGFLIFHRTCVAVSLGSCALLPLPQKINETNCRYRGWSAS